MRPTHPSRGATLVEVAVAAAILTGLFGAIVAAFTFQANVTGEAGDGYNVLLPADVCLQRIRHELKSAVQNPNGITASPIYAVSATSITFRRAEGFKVDSNPDVAARQAAGLISSYGVVYEPYATTIAYDAAAREVRLTRTGSLPGGIPASEVLARNVIDFAFFDGESKTDPPAAPTVSSWSIGVRVLIQRTSAAPGAKGAQAESTVAGTRLTTKVRLLPELLLNKQSKPAVGP